MPEETVGAADLAGCTCEVCKRKKGDPHHVRELTIHPYSSQPRGGWVPRRTAAEMRAMAAGERPAPTFGVELETSVPRYVSTDLPGQINVPWLPFEATPEQVAEHARLRDLANDWYHRNAAHQRRQREAWMRQGYINASEAVSLASPRGLWHSKYDSSVSGPEFASQPATLAYWRAQAPAIATMFRTLLHGGMRSHDGDTCGLHINIGTDAFDNDAHLARFAQLIGTNPRWTVRMSQRTHDSLSHWAVISSTLTNKDEREYWAAHVMRYGYGSQAYGRYCALNAENPGRMEFRAPRGTLRVDRFYAKLEWAASMIEYTRDANNVPQVSAYMRWTAATGEYPQVVAYMRERFSAERFAEPAERQRQRPSSPTPAPETAPAPEPFRWTSRPVSSEPEPDPLAAALDEISRPVPEDLPEPEPEDLPELDPEPGPLPEYPWQRPHPYAPCQLQSCLRSAPHCEVCGVGHENHPEEGTPA